MKVLIVDDDNDIREIIEFTFNCEVESDFLHAASGNEAIDLIKSNDDISLIICDYNMPNGTGGDVYKHLLETKNSLPYVFCSSDLITDHNEFKGRKNVLGEITKPYIFDGIQGIIETFNRNNKSSEQFQKNEATFLTVSIELILKTKVLPCDLFMELNNGKIIKLHNKGDAFSSEEYDKYSGKGIECLLISKDNALDYVSCVCDEIINILLDKDKTSESKVFDAHSVIMTTVSELGLSDKVVRATSSSVDYALEVFEQSEDFEKIKNHIFGHPGKYLTTHSIALAYIGVAILIETSWDSPETRNKLVLASFLHDATITYPDFTESIFDGDSDLLNFRDHPKQVQEILKKLSNWPPDLDKILLEHHERPDGSGFPRTLDGTQVHPLSALFIFSHDIVDLIFKLRVNSEEISETNVQKLVTLDDYTIGSFQKCYDAFLKAKIFK